VDRIGNRWKRITDILLERHFEHRERKSITNRAKILHGRSHHHLLHDAFQGAVSHTSFFPWFEGRVCRSDRMAICRVKKEWDALDNRQ
jgi:hypothetical protein